MVLENTYRTKTYNCFCKKVLSSFQVDLHNPYSLIRDPGEIDCLESRKRLHFKYRRKWEIFLLLDEYKNVGKDLRNLDITIL